MIRPNTVEGLEVIFPDVCAEWTSADPDGWTLENPLWGHCAVVALVVQDYLGGEILRASLLEFPEFAKMRSHYWNRLPDGQEKDFSRSQFGRHYPTLVGVPRSRQEILADPGTARRYQTLRDRVASYGLRRRGAS